VKLTDLQKGIVRELQGDMPLESRPFQVVAAGLGVSEEEVLAELASMKDSGILRRIAAILYHREAGFKSNVMCAWNVSEEAVDEAGRELAAFSEVSHCYRRPMYPQWPYNLYTMVHGRSREECEAVVKEMAGRIEYKEYRLLYSEREFKKSSMEYF